MTNKWLFLIVLMAVAAIGLVVWWVMQVPKPQLTVTGIEVELPAGDLAVEERG